MDSGVPNDRVVNTWHFLADDTTELDTGPLNALTSFYTSIATYLSAAVQGSASWFRAYDLADPEPRAPVIEDNWNLGSTGATKLPPELAVVLSYEAPQQSGQSQARRRGRIYLGPFYVAANDSSAGVVLQGTVDGIAAAAQTLLDASQAATTWSWQIYSRVNASSIEVMHAWVDNAWDVQRSRGLLADYVVDVV